MDNELTMVGHGDRIEVAACCRHRLLGSGAALSSCHSLRSTISTIERRLLVLMTPNYRRTAANTDSKISTAREMFWSRLDVLSVRCGVRARIWRCVVR